MVNEPSVFEPLKFYGINKVVHAPIMTCFAAFHMQVSGQYYINTEYQNRSQWVVCRVSNIELVRESYTESDIVKIE